ncbi:MAG: transglutaminase domain-containing protein [Planctomycetota bacterium]
MQYVIFGFIGIVLSMAGATTEAVTPTDIGDVCRTIDAPDTCPTGLAWDGHLLWVADRKSDRLYAIDPSDKTIQSNLEAPGFWPIGLAYDGEQLWIADRDQKLAFRMDVNSGIVTRTLELDLSRPADLAWDGSHLWCVDDAKDRIVKLDPEDGTAIESFPSPSANPTGLAYDGSYLWVADRIDDSLYRVDRSTGRAIMRISSPGPYPIGLAFGPLGLFCADYQSDLLECVCTSGSRKTIISDPRKARVSYVTELINYGPGTVATSDFYIAVPSDGINQKLLGEVVFDPEPTEFVTDAWGQVFAHFRNEDIHNAGRAQAVMQCDVELSDVLYLLSPENSGTFDEIPEHLKTDYLKDGSKYDLHNEYIASTARKLKGDETNVLKTVFKIYDFVIDHIEYEMVGGWNTAATVLKRGTGSCSEYSFSFIALCRAAGIPARYAGSVVVRGDDACFDDVFHRWAEVYLPNFGWVPFDPSRGDKPQPAEQLKGLGWLANTLFITTRSGGGSEFLGWTYNSETRYTTQGRCKVKTEQIAEWEPLPEQ